MSGKCGNGVCICDEGWTGMDCTERKCLPGCEQHGHCNNGTCMCMKGWNGENCHIGLSSYFTQGRYFKSMEQASGHVRQWMACHVDLTILFLCILMLQMNSC